MKEFIHTLTQHTYTFTRVPPYLTCTHTRVHVHALSVLTCTHMYTGHKQEHIHRHTHMCTTHPSTPLGLQMGRKSCFWDVSFQGCGQFSPPRWVPEMSRLPPYPGFPFFGSFVVYTQGFRHSFRPKLRTSAVGPGAGRSRVQTQTSVPIHPCACPALSGPCAPHPQFGHDFISTLHLPLYKSPGPSGPVPRVGLGEAGQLRVGGALLAPRGLLEPGQCCGN